MHRKVSIFAAALALGLLTTAGSASAAPGEECRFDGQFGHSYETIGRNSGWHMWQCESGQWYYYGFCGNQMCMIP
jgi:hypothetical protein